MSVLLFFRLGGGGTCGCRGKQHYFIYHNKQEVANPFPTNMMRSWDSRSGKFCHAYEVMNTHFAMVRRYFSNLPLLMWFSDGTMMNKADQIVDMFLLTKYLSS